jgi:cation diffusion facilitator family transporter
MGASCCEGKSDALKLLRLRQAKILKVVLAINATMFVVEFTSGIHAKSTSLLGDSLDMFGDATVYAFSLFVLDRGPRARASAALLKGLIMLAFALFVLAEAARKTFVDVLPAAETIGSIGALALVANGVCLWLLWRHRSDDINMRSTWFCSRNDIIANIGVILAAVGVWVTSTKWPDIIVGSIIAALFFSSAVSVLRESLPILRAQGQDRGP